MDKYIYQVVLDVFIHIFYFQPLSINTYLIQVLYKRTYFLQITNSYLTNSITTVKIFRKSI